MTTLKDISKFIQFSSAIFLWVHYSFVGMSSDWPQFLGPERNGISDEVGLAESWPESGPRLSWKLDVGTGYSAPSIRDGKVVLHHRVKDKEIVLCLHETTGEKIWEYSYVSQFTDPYGYNNGPRCTPILTENLCFTFGAEGRLSCLNLQDGTLVWEVATQEKWKVPEAFFGVGSTPILEDNTLFVMVGGQPNSGIVAFEATTGKVLWENAGKSNWDGAPMIGWPGNRDYAWTGYEKVADYSSLVMSTIHGQKVLLGVMRHGLVALNPDSGQIHFSHWFMARVPESVNAMNPMVFDNQVLISSCYYRQGSILLNIDPDIKIQGPAWKGLNLEIHFTTPVLHDGYIYAFSGRNPPDASFRCVEWKTGNIQWQRDESFRNNSDSPARLGRGSAILADQKLFVLGETGILALIKADPSKLTEVCRARIQGMDYPSWTAPVLANGHLFLRSESSLIRLNILP
jgi:outer membrane protein assembly factor BamB